MIDDNNEDKGVNKDLTLKQKLDLIMQNQIQINELIKEKKAKKFRLPWRGRLGRFKARRGFASIMYIGENRNIKFMKLPIEDGVIDVNGTLHVATTDYILTYKNKPFLVVPQWSQEPFSPKEHFEKKAEENKLSVGPRLILNKLEMNALKPKKGMGAVLWIVLLLVIGGGAYYLYQSGAFT